MDIVKRNFFSLMRSGGFNEFVELEPMSPYKWRQLANMAIARNVVSIINKGIRHHQYDKQNVVPIELVSTLNANESPEPKFETTYSLSNVLFKRRLKKIKYDECHTIDTSVETIELLDILIGCITTTLNNDFSIRHTLRLGLYLRTKGQMVDFVKLNKWITRLHIQRMAQLQGCVLIEAFAFEKEEIPFVHTLEPKVAQLLAYSLKRDSADYDLWHISDSKPVFVRTNYKALGHNFQRCCRYFRYAPIESVSNLLGSMARSISEIEE